ncbi:MAG: hypothetical protein M3277_09325 [Actinomycetota bacterium]|nr:hypothetical protein [Actinomycetota bacterium]
MSKTMAGVIVALMLALGACNDDPLEEIQPDATPIERADCGSLSQPTLGVLASGITGGNILNLKSIEATTAGDTWLVAGEMEGKGFKGDGDVALWATTTDPEGDDADLEFTAVNDVAVEASDWPPDDELSEDDAAVEVLFECVADRKDL